MKSHWLKCNRKGGRTWHGMSDANPWHWADRKVLKCSAGTHEGTERFV